MVPESVAEEGMRIAQKDGHERGLRDAQQLFDDAAETRRERSFRSACEAATRIADALVANADALRQTAVSLCLATKGTTISGFIEPIRSSIIGPRETGAPLMALSEARDARYDEKLRRHAENYGMNASRLAEVVENRVRR